MMSGFRRNRQTAGQRHSNLDYRKDLEIVNMNRTLPTSQPAPGLLISERRGRYHMPRGVIYRGWLAVSMFVAGKSGFAQEAVRTLMAADIPRQASGMSSESQPFTIKSGDFRLLA